MTDPRPDIEILSQIMLMQTTLHVIQDESKLGDFICHGLKSLPGIRSAFMCLEGNLVAVSGQEIKRNTPAVVPCPCSFQCNVPCNKNNCICPRTNSSMYTRLALQTSRRRYGGIFIEISNEALLKPYLSYIQNTVNQVALVIENQRNEKKLKRLAADLEQQVYERTQQLQNSNLALQESEQRYATAQKAANIGSWTWDFETNKITWSETIEPMFGLKPGGFGGTYESFMKCVHPDDVQFLKENIMQALDNRESAYVAEHRIVRPDQEVRWVLETGDVISDDEGKPVRMVGIVQDITDRKQAEFERSRLLRTLKAKNDELQSIVYVASHDLRTPLVNIQGFNQELYHECKTIMDLVKNANVDPSLLDSLKPIIEKNIPESMQYIKISADKMAMLLNGLLQISRVGTADIRSELLNMNQLVDDVMRTFEYLVKLSHVDCIVEDLPTCRGDEHQLFRVFSNIISNAIKYLDPERSGVIRISGKTNDSQSIYCIEDNGIGIESAHQKKVFELFHRLNPNDAVGGEGLGLAIVRRIVDRLDGKIELDSTPGVGSKFYIYLPRGKSQDESVQVTQDNPSQASHIN